MSEDIIYQPSAVQQEAHLCDARELLYGGTAGCGKTVFMLHDPIQTQLYGEIERWESARAVGGRFKSKGHALYLRREFPMLQQVLSELLDVAHRIDPKVHWDAESKTFTFQCGFKYQLGHVQREEDWRIYDSNNYTWIGFDEAIQFMERQYIMICTRVRTTDSVLMRKLRIRLASNPDAPADGQWVKKRFVDPAPEGRKLLVEPIKMTDGSIEERTRVYIPARLSDNPNEQYRRDYEASLRQLPHHVMLARLGGDWNVVADAFFAWEWKPEVHMVKPFEIPKHWTRFRSGDWGYKKACPIYWWVLTPDGDLIAYREVTFNHEVPESKRKDVQLVALAIRKIEIAAGEWDMKRDCSKLTGPMDTQMWSQSGTIGPSMDETMAAHGVYWEKCTKDRVASTAEFIRRLRDIPTKPGTRPGITFFDTCRHAARTIPTIQTDKNNMEAPAEGGNDHWLNAIQYAVMYRAARPEQVEAPEKNIEEFDDEENDVPVPTKAGGGYFQ